MNKIKRVDSQIFLFIIAIILASTSYMLLNAEDTNGFGSNFLFYASIFASIVGLTIPILSLKWIKIEVYQINYYSLGVSCIGTFIIFISSVFNGELHLTLVEFSEKGGLWAVNTALLFFHLYIMMLNISIKFLKKMKSEKNI